MTYVPLVLLWALSLSLLPAGARADERKVYFFGNSLIHHLSETDETTVPHWLARMAQTAGHGFAADGQWGFLRDFARPGPPLANWSFGQVGPAWDSARTSFARAGWDAIVVNPANFIQHRPPDAPYEGDNPDGASPLSALLALIDAHGVAPVLLYEGWAEMQGRFPPDAAAFAAYNAYNRGPYHAWYETLVDDVRKARPGVEIRLVPVASVLAGLFSEGPLAGVDPGALYVDSDPHGTPTLYLLAAMVTYTALYGEPAPVGLDLPDSIAPDLRRAYPLVALDIARALERAAAGKAEGPGDGTVAAAPVTGQVAGQDAGTGGGTGGETEGQTGGTTSDGGEAVGLENPSLAMGLNGIADWSTEQPFVDIMKTARPWLGHEGAQWGAWDAGRLKAGGFLDENGWPMRFPPGVDRIESFILTDQAEGAAAMAGRYRVRWEGQGRLLIGGRARNTRHVKGKNEAWFDYTPGSGEVALTILSTDPEGTGDHIRDIEVVREDQIALHDLGVTFNPQWIARIADLRAVRFMDWMLTNGSPVTRWRERPRLSDFSYAWRGVPAEVMIALANRIGADAWVNMPHAADDGYSQAFAEMVRERLDPRLRVYVEYSNEVWNHGFPQAGWLGEQARARWGGKAGDDAWMQFAGMRAAEVMRIWGSVFDGDDADRLVRVVAVHTGWMGLEEPLLDAPLWQAEPGQGRISPAAHFDAYAVSGYFGFELGDGEEGRLDEVRKWIAGSRAAAETAPRAEGLKRRALEAAIAPLRFDEAIPRAAQAIREGSLAELVGTLWPYHAKVARRHGLALIMYEGGTHATGHGAAMNDEELTAFFHKFSYSEAMAALYREEMAAWRDAGGALFNAFVDVARPSQFGSWGALRHLEDDNPRWRALMEDNARPPAQSDERAPGTFLQGVMRKGSAAGDMLEGTVEEDILLALGGDDVITSHGGGDFIDGGDGVDLLRLPGRRDDYGFAMLGERLLARRGSEETALRGIEKLEFTDDPGKVYRLDLP